MKSKRAWALAAVGVLALAIVLLVALEDDDGGDGGKNDAKAAKGSQGGKPIVDLRDGFTGPSPSGPPPTIVIANGKPVGGVKEILYDKWDKVRFKVKSDVAGVVHVDGYDETRKVKAGGTARFYTAGSREGSFDVELTNPKMKIARLRVVP